MPPHLLVTQLQGGGGDIRGVPQPVPADPGAGGAGGTWSTVRVWEGVMGELGAIERDWERTGRNWDGTGRVYG